MLILKKGDRGKDVARLQILLLSKLVPPLNIAIDGFFGETTETAVRLYQKQRSLKDDGVVGPQTWLALNQSISKCTNIDSGENGFQPNEITDWMNIAKAELGVSENTQDGQSNERIIEYHKETTLRATSDDVAWCSSFVNWVMKQAGYSGTKSAAAKSWLTWGRGLQQPMYGAITVIKGPPVFDRKTGSSSGYHVGFFIEDNDARTKLLGGNQKDKVCKMTFEKKTFEVQCYRFPEKKRAVNFHGSVYINSYRLMNNI